MASLAAQLSVLSRRAWRVFSQRARAALLSVALVVSAAMPAGVAVAQQGDQHQEGIAAPEQTTLSDSTTDPDFDPGGETALPFDVGVPGDGGEYDSGDGAPVDVEPVTDPDAPALPVDDPAATAPNTLDGTDEPAPLAEVAPPAQPAQPTPPPVLAPTPVPPPAETAIPPVDADQPAATDRPATHRVKRKPARKRQRDRARRPRVTMPAAAPAADTAPVARTTAAPTKIAPTPEPGVPSRAGQRTHTVQHGESLWTIASDLLGAGATNAEILAESHRLYRLNRSRIGLDPNMLLTGTVLRLR